MIIPVILAGGSGTRLWPISTQELPKQFALLEGPAKLSLFQSTLLRTKHIQKALNPIIITNQKYVDLVTKQLEQIDFGEAKIILEPEPKNTAPAITLAALAALKQSSNPTLLVLPSDHLINDITNFLNTIDIAIEQALKGKLVCFGVIPTHPETGFGYIKIVDQVGDNSYKIERFVEKPHLSLAQEYLAAKNYFWNAGMFVFQAESYLEELGKFNQDIYATCAEIMQSVKEEHNIFNIPKITFTKCPSDSIDYAVMERTAKGVLVKLDAGWSDVGSWQALWQNSPQDQNGNVISGEIQVKNVSGSYIQAVSRKVMAIGIKDCIIIETKDAVLVVSKDRSQDVKKLVAELEL